MIINKGASVDGDPKSSQPKAASLPPEVERALQGYDPEVKAASSLASVASLAKQVAAPVAAAVASGSAVPTDQTALLIELLSRLTRSIDLQAQIAERAGKKDLEEDIKLRTKREQYARNRGDETLAVKTKQANCDHLKGGKFKFKDREDYAVFYHRFIDASCFIKCVLCKMKWYPTDTPDTIFRGGEAKDNYTHIGWVEASRMCFKKSTNQWSASELATVDGAYNERNKATIPDTLGVITGPSQ
jgi:hypothetical protein